MADGQRSEDGLRRDPATARDEGTQWEWLGESLAALRAKQDAEIRHDLAGIQRELKVIDKRLERKVAGEAQ